VYLQHAGRRACAQPAHPSGDNPPAYPPPAAPHNADNFFDAGSCIDGRLTSAWNWCSKVGSGLVGAQQLVARECGLLSCGPHQPPCPTKQPTLQPFLPQIEKKPYYHVVSGGGGRRGRAVDRDPAATSVGRILPAVPARLLFGNYAARFTAIALLLI
jgi:hypothetical protein